MKRAIRFKRVLRWELIGCLFIIVIAVVYGCEQKGVNSPVEEGLSFPIVRQAADWNLPDELRKWYWEDAAQMALRMVKEAGGKAASEVELPELLVRSLYNALIHVYNTKFLPARDSVTDILEIHTYLRIDPHRMGVNIDSTEEWTKAWQRGERLTGNPEVDRLMITYNLQLAEYVVWPYAHWAYLYSAKALNTPALIELFKNINGVLTAGPNAWAGDGNDIDAQSGDGYLQLDYSVGAGDCQSGCMHRHFWGFRVYANGKVQYVGSWGY